MARRRRRSSQRAETRSPNRMLPLERELFEPIRPALPLAPIYELQKLVTRAARPFKSKTWTKATPPLIHAKPPLNQKILGGKALSGTAPNRELLSRSRVCVDRQQRREVLHALKVAGKSGLSPRRTSTSKIKC